MSDDTKSETRLFEGRVIAVTGGTFTAELIDCVGDSPSVHADFPMRVVRNAEWVEAGDIIDIFDIGTGVPVVRLHLLGKWTQAELDAVMERARLKHNATYPLFD